MRASQYEHGPEAQTPNEARIAELENALTYALRALKWAESALAPFSKEPAEKSGMSLVREALAIVRAAQ